MMSKQVNQNNYLRLSKLEPREGRPSLTMAASGCWTSELLESCFFSHPGSQSVGENKVPRRRRPRSMVTYRLKSHVFPW